MASAGLADARLREPGGLPRRRGAVPAAAAVVRRLAVLRLAVVRLRVVVVFRAAVVRLRAVVARLRVPVARLRVEVLLVDEAARRAVLRRRVVARLGAGVGESPALDCSDIRIFLRWYEFPPA
jgi:hypothetical protein